MEDLEIEYDSDLTQEDGNREDSSEVGGESTKEESQVEEEEEQGSETED